MSETPRVDDREFAAIDLKPSSRVVYASFARQLETELANSEKKVFAYKTALEQSESELADAQADADHWKGECNALQRMAHEARAEIERKDKLIEQMLEALEACAEFIHYYDQEHNIGDGKVLEQAIAALSAAERGE